MLRVDCMFVDRLGESPGVGLGADVLGVGFAGDTTDGSGVTGDGTAGSDEGPATGSGAGVGSYVGSGAGVNFSACTTNGSSGMGSVVGNAGAAVVGTGAAVGEAVAVSDVLGGLTASFFFIQLGGVPL